MVTLTIILLLLFIPASRRILGGMLSAVLAALGIAVFVTRNSSSGRRRGL
jgi:hypothetical protein